MENIEENGSNDPNASSVSTTASNIVQLISPQQSANSHQTHAQSVIQQTQPHSVIQTAAGHGIQAVKSVLLVNNKNQNSVIHTTAHQAIQIKPEPISGHLGGGGISDDDSDLSDDDLSPKKRRDLLTRRPSYRKILNDLGGAEIGNMLSSGNPGDQGSLHGSNIVQYGQDGSVVNYVPVNLVGGNVIAEDQSRKREMRLLKNREAARECRRKKKEYIKCLENRVAVLENQNKALIEELKSLKELYCQQKND